MNPNSCLNDPTHIRATLKTNSEQKGQCRLWTGVLNTFGAPEIRVNGATLSPVKTTWFLEHGYKPKWNHMRNKCGNEHCINPAHWEDFTPQDQRKGELVRTPVQRMPVFSLEECGQIWERFRIYGEKLKDLAKEYRVCLMTVQRAVKKYDQYLNTQG